MKKYLFAVLIFAFPLATFAGVVTPLHPDGLQTDAGSSGLVVFYLAFYDSTTYCYEDLATGSICVDPGTNLVEFENISGTSVVVGTPIGDIDTFDFNEGSGGSGGTSATSSEMTVSNPTQDLFNGILLFMLCFVVVIWLFKRNRN